MTYSKEFENYQQQRLGDRDNNAIIANDIGLKMDSV